MQIDIQMLLDSFETPAVFYRENTVRYFNEWAKHLFPSIAAGKGLPEEFFSSTSAFVPEAHTTGRGTLYLLRPRRPDIPISDLDQITRELRSCLSVMTAASAQLASQLLPQLSPENRHLLEVTGHSLYRLRRLADHSDLLRQLEGQSGAVYREGPVDLAGLCRELGRSLEQLAATAGIRFRLDCTLFSLPSLGDSELLHRMLLNLISNAIHAAGHGGEIGLRLEQRGGRAVFTIWDNGSGMEPDRLLAVFRPQPRRHRLPKPEDGAALGLRLVREIAVLHQGLILAENRPEGGVAMIISLPIRKAPSGRLSSSPAWGDDGFQLILTELADVLPASVYTPEDLEG